MPFALEQLTEGLSIAAVINPQNLTQNTSANSGNGIDASKFRRIMAVVLVGAGGGNITAKLQSASTSGGTFNDVAGTTITAITTTNKQATIELRDDQLAGLQWVRLVISENNVAATQTAGLLLGGEGDWKPAKAQDPASVAQRLVK